MNKKSQKKNKTTKSKDNVYKPSCPDCGKTSGMYLRRDGGILAGSWACICGWSLF